MYIILIKLFNYIYLGIIIIFFDGIVFEVRVEVGIFIRNILIRGFDNVEWNDKILLCFDGFDIGIFSN